MPRAVLCVEVLVNSLSLLMYFAVLAVAFYLLIIRPQQQRQRQQRELMASLKPGDRVLTMSGFFGTVVSIDGDKVTVRIAQGVDVDVVAQAISQIIDQAPDVPASPTDTEE